MADKKLSDIGSPRSAMQRFLVSTCKVGIAGFISLEVYSLYKVFYILGISTFNRFDKPDINPVFSLATNNWDTLNPLINKIPAIVSKLNFVDRTIVQYK